MAAAASPKDSRPSMPRRAMILARPGTSPVRRSSSLAKFTDGGTITSGELVSASELLRRTGEVPGLAKIMARLGMEGRESLGEAAAAIEFALEGLYLMRRLSKDTADGTAVYRT